MFGEMEMEENVTLLDSGEENVASFSPVTVENTQRGWHSLKITSRNCNVRCTRLPQKITKKVSILSRTSIKAAFFLNKRSFQKLFRIPGGLIF